MLKKLLALAAAFGATTLAVSGSDALPASRASVWSCPRTAVLTALPTLGTVEWRSDYKARKARFSLGLHTFDTVSMGVRLRTGGYSRDRFVNDPGNGATLWFRYSASRVQWLAASWQDEAGFVAGVVRVDFSDAAARRPRSQDCWIFAPPQVTVRFYGHRRPFYGQAPSAPFRGGFGGMLRPWPIR